MTTENPFKRGKKAALHSLKKRKKNGTTARSFSLYDHNRSDLDELLKILNTRARDVSHRDLNGSVVVRVAIRHLLLHLREQKDEVSEEINNLIRENF